MLSIIVNGRPTQIGTPLPSTVHSLQIVCMNVAVPSHQTPAIRRWLKDLSSRLTCEYVSINGVLLATSDISKDSS